MKQLVARIEQLNGWLLNHPTHSKRAEVYDILVAATGIYEARMAIKKDPKGSKQLKETLEVFWGTIPKKYDDTEIGKQPATEGQL